MKDLLGIIKNVKGGWKSSLVGVIFIGIFIYEYYTKDKIDLISIDSALLAIGLALLFAPGEDNTPKSDVDNDPLKYL